jgi:hypothetical protein
MTDSHSDEKLCDIISESGPEAYGMWWLVLEIVAKQMDKNDVKCSVEYSLSQWSRLCFCHHNKINKYLNMFHAKGLLIMDYFELTPPVTPPLTHTLPPPVTGGVTGKYGQGKIRVTIPNLLKFRDEYSKKSGQAPESV